MLYAAGIAVSFFRPWLAGCIYVFVALMWLCTGLGALLYRANRDVEVVAVPS